MPGNEAPATPGAFDDRTPPTDEWFGTWMVGSGKVGCAPLIPEFDVAGPPRLGLVATVLRSSEYQAATGKTSTAPLISRVVNGPEVCTFEFDLDASGRHAVVRPATCHWTDPMNGEVALSNRHETLDLVRGGDGQLGIHSVFPEEAETLAFANVSCAYRQDVVVVRPTETKSGG
jgi:hypothetical protein